MKIVSQVICLSLLGLLDGHGFSPWSGKRWTDGRTHERYTLSLFFCGGWYLFEGLELLRILPGGVNRLYIGIEIRECLRKCEVL